MKLLAVESADGAASLAYADGQTQTLQRNAQMRDSLSWFMAQAEQLRTAHFGAFKQLDALACCTGPGGFTGVRVAVGYVQGLGLASGVPCIGISSLDAMAASSALAELPLAQDKPLWLALDARMNELYLAPYGWKQGRWQRQGEMALWGLEQARERIEPDAQLAGPGFQAWPGLFGAQTHEGISLDAAGVLAAAQQVGPQAACPAAQLQPVYLRNQVAKTLAQRGL